MRGLGWLGVGLVVLISGCGRTSSLLLERHARGPLEENSAIAHRVNWQLDPVTQTQSVKNVDVIVTFASQQYLRQFFNNKEIFGTYAGMNPYFPENLVFYMKVANHGPGRIAIYPVDFTLTDDRGNQYSPINEDYINAIAEAKAPVAVATRGMIEDAHPGYFGIGLPLGKMVNTKPQGRFALIKQSSIKEGMLYSSVVHDGLIAFWSPSIHALTLKLVVTVKTGFDAEGRASELLELPFTFAVKK